MIKTRICNLCPENGEQDISNFGKYTSIYGKVLYRHRCNKCRRKESAKRYAENPEVQKKMKLTAKAYRFNKKYNITIEEYDNLFLQQDGKCKICGQDHKVLNIDHCHVSGRVRGLLCWKCNIALGYFKDNVTNLINAIKYLGG